MNSPAIIELNSVSISFGALQALNRLSLNIYPGEVVGLMGDNGAGKSTAIKIISGYHTPTSGEILINGIPETLTSTRHARALGIEAVYQDLALCDNLSVVDNIFLGQEVIKFRIGGYGILDRTAMRTKAVELLSQLQSDTPPDSRVGGLSGGQRQAVAISRALLSDARLIILDEPTAAISVRQVSKVLSMIRTLKSRGVAVILISHRMPDIFEVCDRIAVLRRGELVADKSRFDTTPEEITALITGALDRA